jgi:hypothetical protein
VVGDRLFCPGGQGVSFPPQAWPAPLSKADRASTCVWEAAKVWAAPGPIDNREKL